MYKLFSFSILFSQEIEPVFEYVSVNADLAHFSVRSIHQDKTGFMWFGTLTGLYLYDGQKFVRLNDPNSNSISNYPVMSILETIDDNLWIGTAQGLIKYNTKDGSFEWFLNNPEDPSSIGHNYVNGMVEDRYGNLWIITNAGISFYNTKTKKFKNYINDNKEFTSNPISIALDSDGNVLVGYENSVLDYIFIEKEIIENNATRSNIKCFNRFFLDENDNKSHILCIYQSSDKQYWFGTYGSGFFSISYDELQTALQRNSNKLKCKYYNSYFKNHNNLFPTIITDISEDKNNNIYITSFGDGLYCYNHKNNDFKIFRYNELPGSLNSDYLYSIYIDKSDNIWIGTYSGGINKYSANKTDFKTYHAKRSNSLLRSNVVSAIYEDEEEILWVGSREGLTKVDRKKRTSESFSNASKIQINIRQINIQSSNHIRSIIEDNNNRIWAGSASGLQCFDKKSKRFIEYNPSLQKLTDGNYVRALALQNNTLWVASYFGLIKYNLSNNQFIVYKHREDDPTTIGDNHIWSLHLDRFDNLWIGHRKGLSLFDQTTETFVHFFLDDSTSYDNIIVTIASDNNYNIWAGTWNKGLFRLKPSTINYKKPDYSGSEIKIVDMPISDLTINGVVIDSKQSLWFATNNEIVCIDINDETNVKVFDLSEFSMKNQFTTGVYLKNKSGEIFFGGNNGLLYFFPDEIKYNNNIPPIVITSIMIGDSVHYSGTVATYRNEIVLNRSQGENHLTISFVALEFTNPQHNYYKYMLEGYDTNWIEAKENNIATYMNLKPGEYTFKVKGSNNNKIWNETSNDLKVIIKPSFWERDESRLGLALAVLFFLYAVLEIRSRKIEKQKKELELKVQEKTNQLNNTNKILEQEIAERKEIQKNITKTNELLTESNRVKDRLFSIISHDIKGSLVNFKDMLKTLLDEFVDIQEEQLEETLEDMYEAAEFNYNLLETLLVWATSQREKIELAVNDYDISLAIKAVAVNLQYMARSKNIKLNLDMKEGYFAQFDKNTIDIVIRNLTTNALKFTPLNGNVWYTIEKQDSHIIVSINDDGVGIPKDTIDKIFNEKKRTTSLGTKGEKGTGIGLMLCKDFVEKNGGNLWVESELGKGSSFKFSLPISQI
jgi:ligand-binding sensor domain-containing protein/signal transduction histidine kinase